MVSREFSTSRSRGRSATRSAAGRRHDAKPAVGYLEGTAIGAAWQQLSALGRDLAALQPGLALTPLKLERGVLVVTAGSAGVAARLRQFEPRLVRGLQVRGWLVERIRFRPIAIHDRVPAPAPREKRPVSDQVVADVAALAASDVPESLRAALDRFVRRQRTYRTDN